MRVDVLWMNRPWMHVDALMPYFQRFQDRQRLFNRLRSAFEKVAVLEQLALAQGTQIMDAFQGARIGPFTVLSPSLPMYLRLVAESEKTPVTNPALEAFRALLDETVSDAEWGEESLKGDTDGTSPDNETSVVQFADVCGKKVLLTGDAGVQALTDAFGAALQMGLAISPLDWFQVPHHGSRRNLSSFVLDAWLQPRLSHCLQHSAFDAAISANTSDPEHPRNAVVRALIHRGGRVFQTREKLHMRSIGAPDRGWPPEQPLEYPRRQEG